MVRRILIVGLAMLVVGGAGAFAQESTEPTVAVSVTPTQLGWMAYGAPIETFEAMGCHEPARDVEQGFKIADSVSVVGNVLGLAAAAAIGTNALDLELKLGPIVVNAQVGATLVSVAMSGASRYLKWKERQDARARAMEIARLHLEGESTCLQSAAALKRGAAAR